MALLTFVNKNPNAVISIDADDNALRALAVARRLAETGKVKTFVVMWPYTIKASIEQMGEGQYHVDSFKVGTEGILFRMYDSITGEYGFKSAWFQLDDLPQVGVDEASIPDIVPRLLAAATEDEASGVHYVYTDFRENQPYFSLDLLVSEFPGDADNEDECNIELRYQPAMFLNPVPRYLTR